MSQREQQSDDRDDPQSTQSFCDEAEKELREAAKRSDLHAGMKAAFKMIGYQPSRAAATEALFTELFPVSGQPHQSASLTSQPEPLPTSESAPRYPRLSEEQKDRVLDDLKEHIGHDMPKQESVSPSQYARMYASGLVHRAEVLASSLVAFSGQQPASEAAADSEVAFENHFEMELAGFEPVTKDICSLVAPRVSEMANESLFSSAYQISVAFLCLYSADVAHKSMQLENAEEFSYALDFAIATMSAGRFGLHPEPRNVFEAIQELRPKFVCHKMLNMESFGRDDGLGAILNHLRISADRRTRYAFVVGSRNQSLSCATHLVKVIGEISDNIKRCAQEVGW